MEEKKCIRKRNVNICVSWYWDGCSSEETVTLLSINSMNNGHGRRKHGNTTRQNLKGRNTDATQEQVGQGGSVSLPDQPAT
jgi:hypothetical protein